MLRQPLTCAGIDAVGWSLGAVVFFLINLPAGAEMAFHVASVIFMGGLTCTALGYLLVERIMRPVTARALAFGPVQRPRGPGVKGRLVLAWVFATGVPLAGLVLLGCKALTGEVADMRRAGDQRRRARRRSPRVGLLATWLVAKSVTDPLTSMRRAIGRIEDGDLDARGARSTTAARSGCCRAASTRWPPACASASSCATCSAGTSARTSRAPRSTPRRHRGSAARCARSRSLFVDLVGSTSLAAERPPREVVALLNDFFAVVVEVVGRHGGWVNKFEGDAALCVFGAPGDHPDAAGAALAAARELRRAPATRCATSTPAIGVSAGPAVAGNVGAEHRFEYTVIGDPVNEAARLCELAKRRDGRLVASGVTLDRSQNGEGERWACCDEVVLRGRRAPTLVAEPV